MEDDYEAGYAEGFHHGRSTLAVLPVTDTQVERAARKYHELGNGSGSFDRMADHYRATLLFRIRAALEASRGAE